ncbi:MAG: MFS transporter [Myxococcales bacterium]|nr:MFS transporter [Myxococcales bacterium]
MTISNKLRSNPWFALSILCALAFLNYLDRNLLYPLLGLIAKSLELSEPELGAIATGFFVVYAISAPVFGYASDKMSRRVVLLVSLLFWSAVTALSGMASGFFSLLVWRSFTGLGEGGYFPTAISLIGDLFDSRRRGTAIALHGVFATLGGSAGYAVGGVLGEAYGWRTPFFISVIPGVLLAWFVWKYLPDPPRGVTETSSAPVVNAPTETDRSPKNYLSVIASLPVLLISLAACAAAYSMSGLTTWFPRYLEEVQHLSVSAAGSLTGLTFAATVAGQLSGGSLSDRLVSKYSGARPLLAGLSYLIAGPALLIVPWTTLLTPCLLCFAVTQACRGFAEPNLYGTIIDSVESRSRGTAQGFLLLLTFVGSALSPIVTGWLIKDHGYKLAMLSLAAAAIVSGILALSLSKYLRLVSLLPNPGLPMDSSEA